MKFIPEGWEPIYYYASSRKPSYYDVTIEKMIEDRWKADVNAGMVGGPYSIEIEKEDKEKIGVISDKKYIKQLNACHYNNPHYTSKQIARFVVVNQDRTVFYRLIVRSSDYVVLDFVGEAIKESDTILYQIKKYVKENELGDPDDIEHTLTTSEESKQLEDEIEWKAWCGNWVILPTEYDGYYGIEHYPRNP